MSEALLDPSEGHEADDASEQLEEPQEHEEPAEESDEEEEGDGEESAEARLKRAEKQAHDKAGLAAKERSKRRAAERRASELEDRISRLEAQGRTGQQDEVAELIAALSDADDEPITDIAQIKKVLKTFIARQQAEDQAEGERLKTVGNIKSISSKMDAYEKDFAEDHPDYFKAATFYRNARVSELEDLGYTGDRLLQKVAGEFYTLAQDVMKDGRDPAEVVYGLAKKRGFASGKDAATEKLQKLQKASTSASGPRSKGADNGLSWTDVAKLKGAARDAAFAKLRARELGKG